MVKIKENVNGSFSLVSSVTDFCGSMGYCEFRLNHLLKGIKPPPTKSTIVGTRSHKKEEDYEKKHFTFVPVTQKELIVRRKDVEFARESVFTKYQEKFHLNDADLTIMLFGKADKVLRTRETLIIEDSKYPNNPRRYLKINRPFKDQKMQTLVYLNSQFTESKSFSTDNWFEIPHKKKVWRINIKDPMSGDSVRLFEGVQTKQDKEFLDSKILRFSKIALNLIKPAHHNSIKKCSSCSFSKCCDYLFC